jgi:Protein of unknown function (DUF2815)
MTEVENKGIVTLQIPVTLMFPQLFEAKPFKNKAGKEQGDPKFSANFIFANDNPELATMKSLAAKLAREKWPDKQFYLTTTDGQKIQQIMFPFQSGDKQADARKAKGKDDGEFLRGKVIVTSKSKLAPALSYIENKKVHELETDAAKIAHKGKFYAGVEVLAEFNLVAYDAVGDNAKPGVTAYLNKVCSLCRGARIAGGTTSSEAFKGYVGSVSAEDPTAPGVGDGIDDMLNA